jgi:ribose 5-phosphate isomerase B
MAANRLKGIRAGVAMNEDQAHHIRENDLCNIIAIAADYTPLDLAQTLIDAFLASTPKTEEKYLRRIEKLDKD